MILLIAYLLGSIPFGLLLAKLKGIDLRKGGSGNIGATNALRLGGKALGIGTLVLDLLKGSLAVFIASHYNPSLSELAGLIAVIGHMFPVWLAFKGGKGVATALGAILVLNFKVVIIAVIAWGITFWRSKISSLSSLVGCMIGGISCVWLADHLEQRLVIFAILSLIVLRHRENIKRLLSGEERALKR